MKKHILIFIYAFVFCALCGLISSWLYQASPEHAINIEEIQNKIHEKESEAASTLLELKNILISSESDSLIYYPFDNQDISYYVYRNNELIFWSDNYLDVSNVSVRSIINGSYLLLPNAHCVFKKLVSEDFTLVSLIRVKNNFPYQNDELQNAFAQGFNIDKNIEIVKGAKTDKRAFYSFQGNYLFSLSEPNKPIYNELWSIIGLIAFSFAFLLFLFIYACFPYLLKRKYVPFSIFSLVSICVGLVISACLYWDIPSLFFLNKLFSPFQYASNTLLTSISHLSIVTGYFISTVYFFYYHVNTDVLRKITHRFIIQFLFALYFALVFYLMSGLIYHSSIQLAILRFTDFSILAVWVHFLILVWGVSMALMFFKTHNWYYKHQKLNTAFAFDILLAFVLSSLCWFISPDDAMRLAVWFSIITILFYLPYLFPKQKNIYGFIALWLLVFTAFLITNSYNINDNLKYKKYKLLAQNIYVNGNYENDRMADILLEELDAELKSDERINSLLESTDSLDSANKYLNEKYLRGFWNKYEMRLNVGFAHSDLHTQYMKYIEAVGSRIKDTHFFSVPANENNMSYIGAFPLSTKTDSIVFFMEFYPRRNFKSYSFPSLLVNSAPDILTKLNLTLARYENKRLVYSSANVEYPYNSKWIPTSKSKHFKIIYNKKVHYILTVNSDSVIVLTEKHLFDRIEYLYYFLYTFLSYFAVCWLIVWIFQLRRNKKNFRIGLSAKFQYAFVSLLIISFLGIFYVSVNFIQQKYQKQQIVNLENKKNYIQKALQELYYWNLELHPLNTRNLNFDLQDLSYIYHTDIFVYNNEGFLVGSSQPIIFNKSLISHRISPLPFFGERTNINQYENIGKLNYLTGYTDFYNGDFLQIGYIAIPQFFSQDEIQSEIESFLTVIIHIYLIIIVLTILLSLFIGKQLSAPLNMIESKLKEMRIGKRNEKIDYALNDEIGQLVLQYNRTIDELEHSAELLAKSERETAWKSMARQVAHEINNPLTPMKLTIQQMQRTKKMNDARFDDYFKKSTDMLIEQIDHLSRIAGTFSNFARMPEARFEKTDIAAKLHSIVQLFRNNNEEIQIKYSGKDEGVFIYVDPEQWVQVFNNLLKNAIQSIPINRKGKIQVELKELTNTVEISIKDNGSGIADEISDKLFIPNFTTKTTGMGLGLAITKNIIEISGGKISFTTQMGDGTVFQVSVPISE